MPVMVEMRIARAIDPVPRRALEVETAMWPRRDTGETGLKNVDRRVSRGLPAVKSVAHIF